MQLSIIITFSTPLKNILTENGKKRAKTEVLLPHVKKIALEKPKIYFSHFTLKSTLKNVTQ